MVPFTPAEPDDAPGTVVDPEVLAARRAARERPVLEARVRELEAERDALRETAERAQRDLRDVRQREESERRVRVETEDEAAAARRLAEEEVRCLRHELAAAEARVRELAGELERVRSEAEHELAWQRSEGERTAADLARLEAELEAAADGAAAERELLVAELERVRGELGDAQAESTALAAAAAEARGEAQRAAEALAQARADRDAARAALAAAEARQAARDDGAQAAREERDRLAEAARTADDARAQLDAQLAALTAERDLLAARVDELLAERTGAAEAPAVAAEASGDGAAFPRPFALVDPDAARRLREQLDGLAGPGGATGGTVAQDLAAAAARLRDGERAARESSREPAFGEPAVRPPAVSPAVAPPRPVVPISAVVPEAGAPAVAVRPAGRPWLPHALAVLAAEDAQVAGRLLLALLPVQALRLRRELAYELRVDGLDPVRVIAAPGRVDVVPAGDATGKPDGVLTGSVAQLATLAGGGLGRALPGRAVSGRRRLRRPLARALRQPVSLAELARAGARPDPSALLHLLAVAADGSAVRDKAAVRLVSGSGVWRLTAKPGSGLGVSDDPGKAVQATVTVPPAGLLAALAGLPPASGAKPKVTGSQAAVAQLLDLVDRAQR